MSVTEHSHQGESMAISCTCIYTDTCVVLNSGSLPSIDRKWYVVNSMWLCAVYTSIFYYRVCFLSDSGKEIAIYKNSSRYPWVLRKLSILLLRVPSFQVTLGLRACLASPKRRSLLAGTSGTSSPPSACPPPWRTLARSADSQSSCGWTCASQWCTNSPWTLYALCYRGWRVSCKLCMVQTSHCV